MGTEVAHPPKHLMVSMEQEKVHAAIRDAYVMGGAANGPICVSSTCLYLAEVRVFWPVRPGEEYPVYCPACAAWAKQILEMLGVQYRDEPLPDFRPPRKTRQIDLPPLEL